LEASFDHFVNLLEESPLYGAYNNGINRNIDLSEVAPAQQFLTEFSTAIGVDPKLACKEILPKVIGFCALVGNEYLTLEELTPLTASISIVYLCDGLIDSSDKPSKYLSLLRGLANGNPEYPFNLVNEQIEQFPAHLQDKIRQLIFRDICLRQFVLKKASLDCFQNDNEYYFKEYRPKLAENMIRSIGLEGVSAGLYMLLQQKGIVTTDYELLEQKHAKLTLLLSGFTRICDDYSFSDRMLDKGSCINVFNDDYPGLLFELIKCCGIEIPTDFNYGDPVNIFDLFHEASLELIGDLDNYPPDEQKFLILKLKTMEGGFMNLIGDSSMSQGALVIDEEAKRILQHFRSKNRNGRHKNITKVY
jgi:hypothetical protein